MYKHQLIIDRGVVIPDNEVGEFSAQLYEQKHNEPFVIDVVSVARTAKQMRWRTTVAATWHTQSNSLVYWHPCVCPGM